MSLKKEIIVFSALLVSSLAIFPSVTSAQSALDDIKAQLEGAGIDVVDYGGVKGEWGSIPASWIASLNEEFEGMADLADYFDSAFNSGIGLIKLQEALSKAEAEKTQLRQAEAIKIKDEEIKDLKTSIIQTEQATKHTIASFIREDLSDFVEENFPGIDSSAIDGLIDKEAELQSDLLEVEWQIDYGKNAVDPSRPLNSAELNVLTQQRAQLQNELQRLEIEYEKNDIGVDLLFNEINFYFDYNKWGNLPDRLVGILELPSSLDALGANTPYENLQILAEEYNLTSNDAAEREAGLATLKQALAKIPELSAADREVVANNTLLVTLAGESQLSQIGQLIARGIQNLAAGIAVLWIVVSGARMIFAQGDDSAISEEKNALLYGVIGLAIILLIGRLVEVLYGPLGVNRTTLVADEGFSNEVYGVVSFLKALVGTIAVFFIILSASRTLFSQGDEGEITKERTSILWVGVGLVLMAINEIIIKNIFILPASQSDQITTSNVAQIVNTFGTVMKFLLGFVGVIALGILVYGAGMMIMNFGDEEAVENAKKTIRNAVIGILIILSAYAIVASLVTFS